MPLPTSYLTSYKNLPKILAAIQNAQAPKQFTTRYLEGLGFKAAADRLIIGVLKAIGLLTAEGQPTQRYFQFLDASQGKRVLGEAVMDAYADLFQVNRKAYELSGVEIRNKLKTLTQGQVSDSVLDKMAGTFKALAQQADFTQASAPVPEPPSAQPEITTTPESANSPAAHDRLSLGGLVYNIQLILPADRDQAVYDALFRSLREHLIG